MMKCNRKHKKKNEKKWRHQDRTDLVKIHIFWKLYQDNNYDIQQHQFRTSVHSEQDPPEKIAIKQDKDDKYKKGIYKFKFNQCNKVHIGQTGGNLKSRCKEHIHDIRHKDNSKYAKHILDIKHE